MRVQLIVGLAVLGLCAAAPGYARYGYCTAGLDRAVSFEPTGQHYPQLLSEVLDFGENAERLAAAEKAFAAHLRNNSADCSAEYESVEKAREAKRRRIEFSRGTDTDTGWSGGFAATGNAAPKPESSGAFISIKDNGIAARTKAWDDAVLEARRQEAQRKVMAAVLTSAEDPKIKARIAADKARRLRLGRSQ